MAVRLLDALLPIALLLTAAGCADASTSPPLSTPTASPSAATPLSSSPTSAACGTLEEPTVQDGSHLIGDQEPPVPYSSTPGSSGWHSSGAPPTGVHHQALSDPQIVSVLHGGGVVAVYDPARLGDEDRAALEELAADDPDLTVSPYTGDLPTALSLVGWGLLQRCDRFDAAAVAAFLEIAAGAPEDH